MNSRDLIHHPGPEHLARTVSARGEVKPLRRRLKADELLLDAVTTLMDEVSCDSAIIVLDDLQVGPFDYVMPSNSSDGLHAAWYSEVHSCKQAKLRSATAVVGRRDGAWWLHCHALWDTDNTCGLGHLLPDRVKLAADAMVTIYAFNGGGFDVALDSETAFPIFHVHGGFKKGNAFIAKIYPHQDIVTTIQDLIVEAGFSYAHIFGIGSLIGAQFAQGESMECPISEVLISPQAKWNGTLNLPIDCVDTEGRIFHGTAVRGGSPVLVTFEIMVIEMSDKKNG